VPNHRSARTLFDTALWATSDVRSAQFCRTLRFWYTTSELEQPQAIAAGIPQLVVPSTHDQPDNAMRVRRLGLGDFLLPKAYTPANVEERLRRLMSPDVGKNCQRRAKDLAGSQSLPKASLLIEEFARHHIDSREQRPKT